MAEPAPPTKPIAAAFAAEAQDLERISQRRALAHRSACNGWNAVNYYLGIPAAILGVAAGATALGHQRVVTAVLALIAGALAALSTFLNPSQQARLHQHAAAGYGDLQGTFRRFRTIELLVEDGVPNLESELKAAIARFNEIDAQSPPIPSWAYWRHRHLKTTRHQADKDSAS